MKILYFGNFTRSFSTENYVAYALGRLGQEVVEIPNTQFDVWEACKHRIMQEAPDVVLFSKAPVCHTDRILDLCNGHNILSVCWHWDLYFGCGNRSNERWPQLRSDLLFSTDGGHDLEFKNAGYSHQVLRQGIHYPEAIIQPPDYQYDVGFVGHNSEFQPGRPELIAHLSDTYGSRFSYVSNVRGLKLNKWLSQVKVVVGDSYPSDAGGYWSNRVYEVLGRGGFLLHPKVEGLEREFQSKKHLDTYTRSDFAELDDSIDYYLCNTPLQEAIRQAGHEHCRTNYTYFNRCRTLLAYIGAKCPSLI